MSKDEQSSNEQSEAQENGPTLSDVLNEINTQPTDAKAAEYLDALQRERAAFINYKRRVEAERIELFGMAKSEVISKLLVVLDDLELALRYKPAIERFDEKERKWLEGVLAIERKLRQVMENEGLAPIEAVGQPFDPSRHEAVGMEDGEGGQEVVASEYRRGYTYKGKVLRPSMVMVKRTDATGNQK